MSDKDRSTVIEELREQIRRITQRPATAEITLSSLQIDAAIPGRFESTSCGRVFVAQSEISPGSFYGNVRISDFADCSLSALGYVTGLGVLESYRPEDALFLDIETSEPRDERGAVAFLVGLGFFEDRRFLVRQIFLRDPTDEAAGLELLDRYLSGPKFLVTFNGRNFDVPFLAQRARIHGRESPITSLPHLDILPIHRKLWRSVFDNCRLLTLEREIVGIERVEDIPGQLIPAQYDEYRRDFNPGKIRSTFTHNFHDVASMVPMTARLSASFAAPHTESLRTHPKEAIELARIHLKRGFPERAFPFLDYVRDTDDPLFHARRRDLSLLYKKLGRLEDAVRLWQAMVADQVSGADFQVFPYLELARHHEKHTSLLDEAVEILNLCRSRCPEESSEILDDLRWRIDRLNHKIRTRRKKAGA